MRDLAKSMISWAWAMSVFTALQGARLLSPKGGAVDQTATGAFNTVTNTATDLLSSPAKAAWSVGVAAQQVVFQAIAKTTPGMTPAASNGHVAYESTTATASEPMPIESLSSAKHTA